MNDKQTGPTDRESADPTPPCTAPLQESTDLSGADPRNRPNFRAEFYPAANGKPAPSVDAVGRNERITLEFLAVYYELNCRYAALLEARQDPARWGREERDHLQAMEKVLIVRDALEDRYAPLGVIAEPVIKQDFARDLAISFGNADAKGQPRRGVFTIAAHVPLPLAPGSHFQDWEVKIQRNRDAA